ncbi:uncharacterized protein COLE_05446 [Cutaneotrichosporon oleaginosum]|uniref:uncharacterized protein n=1 Tax=Cutaneotrichosporon oleaginosum TaxID=879819 RepID=UPI001322BBC6|nr:hypothetical protein COLE_05446 [Cutaneotrichosporon oleaginosum]
MGGMGGGVRVIAFQARLLFWCGSVGAYEHGNRPKTKSTGKSHARTRARKGAWEGGGGRPEVRGTTEPRGSRVKGERPPCSLQPAACSLLGSGLWSVASQTLVSGLLYCNKSVVMNTSSPQSNALDEANGHSIKGFKRRRNVDVGTIPPSLWPRSLTSQGGVSPWHEPSD